jgi:hypothetical protein
MASKTNLLQDALSRNKPETMATIIDRLAGDKDNLRLELKHVKFKLRNEKIEVNGTINFNVKHKIPNIHAVLKEEAKKEYG